MALNHKTAALFDETQLAYWGDTYLKSYSAGQKGGQESPDEDTVTLLELANTKEVIPSNKLEKTQELDISHSLAVKQWEGYISEVVGEEFTAVLSDSTGKDLPITAEFSLYDVAEGDRELVKKGAMFYWVIGKEVKTHGQITNADYLIFKRMPIWRGFDVNTPSKKADEYHQLFNSD